MQVGCGCIEKSEYILGWIEWLEMILIAAFCLVIRGLRMEEGTSDQISMA